MIEEIVCQNPSHCPVNLLQLGKRDHYSLLLSTLQPQITLRPLFVNLSGCKGAVISSARHKHVGISSMGPHSERFSDQ